MKCFKRLVWLKQSGGQCSQILLSALSALPQQPANQAARQSTMQFTLCCHQDIDDDRPPTFHPFIPHFNANLNATAKFDFGTKSVEEVLSNSFDGCNSLLWVECKVGRPQKQPLCQSCTPSALNFPPLHKMQRKSVKRQSSNIQHLFNHTCQNKTIKDGFLQYDYLTT